MAKELGFRTGKSNTFVVPALKRLAEKDHRKVGAYIRKVLRDHVDENEQRLRELGIDLEQLKKQFTL